MSHDRILKHIPIGRTVLRLVLATGQITALYCINTMRYHMVVFGIIAMARRCFFS